MTRSPSAITTPEVTSGITQRSQRSWSSSVSRSERSSRSPAANERHREKLKAPTVSTSHRRHRETAAKPSRWALSRSTNRSGERRKAKSSITMSAPRTVRSPGRVALSTNSPTAPTSNATFTSDATTPADEGAQQCASRRLGPAQPARSVDGGRVSRRQLDPVRDVREERRVDGRLDDAERRCSPSTSRTRRRAVVVQHARRRRR